ncbi:amino acid ABC transporter substrate-binding protein [Chitinivorax sp. B]|uniref:amino acid ABC transporter substrate-binding protein n=1 Tax=Chitinivorax sp. B TaxID=2502235 RepID=UPI0010F5824A|nr:amino acid ABC transporter substrate-binding protein [Chitinivorax sp. B]
MPALYAISLTLVILLATAAMPQIAQAAGRMVIVYPKPETDTDDRTRYPTLLLALALKKSGANYVLQPSKTYMQQGRALALLEHNMGEVNVVWSMTSIDREERLRPIRIPIYKGLIGWRIPFISANRQDLLSNVKSVQDLAKFVAGQGHDWPDTEILRANKLQVMGIGEYNALFRTLAMRRFDYFPRSVAEIWAEADMHASDGVVVDRHIALHYPTAFYFFVNKRNAELARLIRSGLEKAIQDGSFDELFQAHMGPYLKAAQLEKRVVLELNNPLLPPLTPLDRPELWYQPGKTQTGLQQGVPHMTQ